MIRLLISFLCVAFAIEPAVSSAKDASPASLPFGEVKCDGDYAHHLQGVCTDNNEAIFWAITTQLVKTDREGNVLKQVAVPNHHGDLCFNDGKVYVAVNLGQFNNPEGKADSWVYVYDAASLDLVAKHECQQVFHGAGGIGIANGHFFVVGGLPEGVQENYVYEYDAEFRFVKKHVIDSKWTLLGIQTATFHDDAWWFGCYGAPSTLLKTDAEFNMIGRYHFNCALGIIGIAPDRLLYALGPKTDKGRCMGTLHLARPDEEQGLVAIKP
ncbi:signal peptide-domain containing protein [Rhodopirellula maiorica SM1]|uniref:Signal peptide-domain containing protein n=1 Tax=Rhodopirellula maiorica SM1 TaxID=1265738 RepID=M5RHW8_9BACT|nr:hypothetical protein [Rhodopirellula maiorica]EMI18898.1 signal peptide-domain containing protein [Rhodopirellula maiorica SM1]